MKPGQTIFNKDNNTVTLNVREYYKLTLYKKCFLEMKEVLTSGDAE